MSPDENISLVSVWIVRVDAKPNCRGKRPSACPLSAKSGHYRTDCRCIDHDLRSSANTHAKVEDMDR